MPDNPQRWAAEQLAKPDATPPGATVTDAFSAVVMDRQDRKAVPDSKPDRARGIFMAERAAWVNQALTTDTPFRERLVWFWANHFTVSIRRGEIAPMVGDYTRTAIRPYVTGRFQDMVMAVMRHPAMLIYLDNQNSAGPNSIAAGRVRPNGATRGLNENLARECMELHTVSPAAGYTQADVTEFARVITGWSVEQNRNPVGFHFNPALHDPGAKTVMGHSFAEGEQGGVDALAFLANHPATHRHLATKLVTHFVSDTPPPAAVRRIEGVLRDTRGDLHAASMALLTVDEAWQPLSKLRTPQEYLIAALRAAELPPSVPPEKRPDAAGIMAGLGQPVFNAPFPIGWPDTASDWSGPEAMLRRIDWAYGFSARPELPEPMLVADTALGPLIHPTTADEIRRAGSRRDAMTLLLGSPEFQRR